MSFFQFFINIKVQEIIFTSRNLIEAPTISIRNNPIPNIILCHSAHTRTYINYVTHEKYFHKDMKKIVIVNKFIIFALSVFQINRTILDLKFVNKFIWNTGFFYHFCSQNPIPSALFCTPKPALYPISINSLGAFNSKSNKYPLMLTPLIVHNFSFGFWVNKSKATSPT